MEGQLEQLNYEEPNDQTATMVELQVQEEEGDQLTNRGDQERLLRRRLLLMAATNTVISIVSGALFIIEQFLSQSMIQRLRIHSANPGADWLSMVVAGADEADFYLLITFLLLQENLLNMPRRIGSAWYIKPRSMHWFLFFIDWTPRLDPKRFKKFFRISAETFYYVCDIVRGDMEKHPPASLRILPNRWLTVERQVALAIRRLASGDQQETLAELFGVSKTTASRVCWNFTKALVKRAMNRHLSWPKGQKLHDVKDGFWRRWGFPNCCGAIDGTHFTIELPQGEQAADYFDYKHNYSVSMQAIVDNDLRFLDVCAGRAGSIQDTRLLRTSLFYREVAYRQTRLTGRSHRCPNGFMLREYILGDGGYPLLDWVIVPYPKGLSAAKDDFNTKHSSARMCVERAFGRLKGTWRILDQILWKPKIDRVGAMITACCLLHNIIIDKGDILPSRVYRGYLPHPRGYPPVLRQSREYEGEGPEARDALMSAILPDS